MRPPIRPTPVRHASAAFGQQAVEWSARWCRWLLHPLRAEVRQKAKEEGLWNLWIPPHLAQELQPLVPHSPPLPPSPLLRPPDMCAPAYASTCMTFGIETFAHPSPAAFCHMEFIVYDVMRRSSIESCSVNLDKIECHNIFRVLAWSGLGGPCTIGMHLTQRQAGTRVWGCGVTESAFFAADDSALMCCSKT